MADINTGDTVRLSASFVDSAGVAADPTTVTLTLSVNGVESTLTHGASATVKDAVGLYHYDYLVPTAESFYEIIYRWAGTGAVTSAQEGMFYAVSRL